MDWLDSLFSTPALNGSTAPNSGNTGLSTPVNTTGGNGNTSGWTLGSVLSTLSGLGSTAANAYAAINGHPATTTTAAPAAAPSLSTYLPWLLGGAGVLILLVVFLKRK